MSKAVLACLWLMIGGLAYASSGDVVEIDHDSLISFTNQQTGNCYITTPNAQQPQTQYLNYTVWVNIQYKDAKGAARELTVPITADGYYDSYSVANDCLGLENSAQSDAASWNAVLTDIQRNNLSSQGNVCLAKYLVFTLNGTTTLPDKSQFETGDYVSSTRVVPCP